MNIRIYLYPPWEGMIIFIAAMIIFSAEDWRQYLRYCNKKDLVLEISGGLNQTNYYILGKRPIILLVGLGSPILNSARNFYEGGIRLRYNNLTLTGEYYVTDYVLIPTQLTDTTIQLMESIQT